MDWVEQQIAKVGNKNTVIMYWWCDPGRPGPGDRDEQPFRTICHRDEYSSIQASISFPGYSERHSVVFIAGFGGM